MVVQPRQQRPATGVDVVSGSASITNNALGTATTQVKVATNGETISGWVPALGVLHQAGLTAMVFDYSGFGDSQGPPTIENLRQDGRAAWAAFRGALPTGTRACAYGLSLGSAILLTDAAELQPAPDCIAVSGVFPSSLEIWMSNGRAPKWAKWFLPDPLDSESAARNVRSPLLVEQG